jgi:hypothetical protein
MFQPPWPPVTITQEVLVGSRAGMDISAEQDTSPVLPSNGMLDLLNVGRNVKGLYIKCVK